MPAITSANVMTAIAKLVSAQALPALVGSLVMGNIVNRDFEPTIAYAGDTVNVPIPPTLNANNIAETGTVTTQNPSLGNAQIVLNTHAEATFLISDVARAMASPDLIATYMSPAINAIAESIETSILATYPQFTANTATGGVSSMDEARIDLCETNLFASKVPAGDPLWLVMSATAYGQTRQLARFTELQTTGWVLNGQPSPIGTGNFCPPGMKVKGFNVYRSQFVAKPSTTTYNLAGHRNAIGLVMRRLPLPLPGAGAIASYMELGGYGFRIIMSYAPNSLALQCTVDCLYGVGVLRNTHGCQVQSN